MPEDAVAATQYGDLKGTVSIDGLDGPFLSELAKKSEMPKGYLPIGISIYLGEPRGRDRWRIDILAADMEASGVTTSDLREYAISAERIPTFSFAVEIGFDEFIKLIKRMHIVVKHKAIGDTPMTIEDDS